MSCNTPGMLSLFYYIKMAMNIIFIGAPIILLVLGTIDFLRATTASDEKKMKKSVDTFIKRLIICVVILILPLIINTVMQVIKKKQEEEKLKKQLENSNNNNSTSSSNSNNTTNTTNSNNTTNTKISISTVNVTDLGCPVYYSTTLLSYLRFNTEVATEAHRILTNVCGYVNNTSLVSAINTAGSYVEKAGYHGRGLAIDLYNNWSYVSKNGTKYSPYSGQGYATWNRYKKFICEVCNGKENCSYNINYQIYNNYFKNEGWCWGGYWNSQYFDPMHFEKSDGGCAKPIGNRINC